MEEEEFEVKTCPWGGVHPAHPWYECEQLAPKNYIFHIRQCEGYGMDG